MKKTGLTENLDRDIWVNSSNGIVHSLEGASTCGRPSNIVTNEKEHVNRLVEIDSAYKPVLLDHVHSLNYLRDISVAYHSVSLDEYCYAALAACYL